MLAFQPGSVESAAGVLSAAGLHTFQFVNGPCRAIDGVALMQLVSETRPPVQRDRFLRLPEVEHLTGLRKSTIYRLMRERQFVQCVQVTPRCTGWSEAKVLQWVQDRIAAATTTQQGAQ